MKTSLKNSIWILLILCFFGKAQSQSIPTWGLIAYYNFDSSTVTDMSGNGHDGTIKGSPKMVMGISGSAYWFDGIKDNINISNSPGLNIGTNHSLSISLWFKIDSNDNDRTKARVIIGKRTNSSDNSDYIIYTEGGHLIWGTGTANDTIAWMQSADPSRNAWHHIVTTLSYDSVRSTYLKKIFFDCKKIKQETGYVKADSVSDPLRIGASKKDAADVFFAGAIDEVRLYNRALTDSEVLALCYLPPVVTSVSGKISTSTGAALASSKVYLVRFNTADTSLTAVDSMLTDGSGNYSFNVKSDTLLYVIAVPDSSSYPHEITTYYDSAYDFSDAKSVSVKSGKNTIVNFHTLHGANAGGIGFIGGKITICLICKNSLGGKPAVGLKIILVDSKGAVQGITYTDKFGQFGFKNIGIQKYHIVVDRPYVKNAIAPEITLDNITTSSNREYILYADYLELEADITGIETDKNLNNTISVYPNPAKNEINISYTSQMNSTVTIELTDIIGKSYLHTSDKLKTSGLGIYKIDATALGLNSGMYIVRVIMGDKSFTKQIFITK